jgi:hypothetical protein
MKKKILSIALLVACSGTLFSQEIWDDFDNARKVTVSFC